jgi:hypothetical protein
MAAPTVTLDTPTALRIGNGQFGVLSGSVTVAAYDTAHPEVTAITGKFKSSALLRVMAAGLSTNGYAINWDHTTKSFKANRAAVTVANPTISTTSAAAAGLALGVTSGAIVTSGSAVTGITGVVQGAVAVAAPTEAGAVNVGTFDFIAIGQLGL